MGRRLIETQRFDPPVTAIARDASVAPSTFYQHFPSREALFDAVADELLREEDRLEAAALARVEIAAFHDDLAALVRHRAERLAARAALVQGLLALPSTQERVAPRGALHAPSLARLTHQFGQRREALHPSLTPAQAAEVAALAVRAVLLGALEERPQYLLDEAFFDETVALVEHAVARSPRGAARWQARTHAHRFQRARPVRAVLRKAPTQARAQEMVGAIVEGTERVVDRLGAKAVTTPRVAEVAGVSVGSLYQYFGHRDALFGALIDRWIERDLAFVERTVAQLAPRTLQGLLEGIAAETLDRTLAFARVYRAVYALIPRVERYGPTQDFMALARAVVARHVASRSDAQGIDAELLTFTVGHAFIGWCRGFLTERPEFFASPAFRDVPMRVARGLTVRG